MSRLIQLIVQDCEELEIETYSREELDNLISAWGGQE
jgi:hypothetical protein